VSRRLFGIFPAGTVAAATCARYGVSKNVSVYDTRAACRHEGVGVIGGDLLGVLIGFLVSLFSMIVRTLRARRTSDWREAMATVVGASSQRSSFPPRPVAEIVYTYRIDGGFYGGVDEKPFFLATSAEEYAEQFAKGDDLVVRVKPGQPEKSIVRDEDFVKPNHPPANPSR
jgi:hypothetical protein